MEIGMYFYGELKRRNVVKVNIAGLLTQANFDTGFVDDIKFCVWKK
jgi:hypothetical protein